MKQFLQGTRTYVSGTGSTREENIHEWNRFYAVERTLMSETGSTSN